jgi:hypothetical protein
MKADLLDDGIGDTLVSPSFDDVTLINQGKGVNLRTRIRMADKSLSAKSASPRELNRSQPNDFLSRYGAANEWAVHLEETQQPVHLTRDADAHSCANVRSLSNAVPSQSGPLAHRSTPSNR